jgi:hypothetical protein
MSPDALISMLAERHIGIEEQPRVFESIIPADRRRFRSQPGGLPSADMVWSAGGAHRIVEVANGDLVATIAQHIIANDNVLIDAAVTLGCVCSGALAAGARDAVVAVEPPRASSPVIDEAAPIQLELRVPAASRTPVDVMAISPLSTPNVPHPALPLNRPPGEAPSPSIPLAGGSWDPPRRQTPPAGLSASDVPNAARQPESRDRRTLPRAYIVRRRPSPRSTPIVQADNAHRPLPPDAKTTETAPTRADTGGSHESDRNGQTADEDEEGEQDEETALEEPSAVAPSAAAEPEPTETPPPTIEPEATVDLLPPPPAPSPVAPGSLPVREFATPPLRVVENTPATEEQAVASRTPAMPAEQPRLLSATRTAVRDLRDAFMVTVSRPGETVTGSQPPDGITGSIGGVTPLMNEQVTMVRVRNVILVILAFVALVVVFALPVLIIVDRRLNPPTVSAPVIP